MNAQPRYLTALDGFRGLAILVVVISHYGFGKWIPGGFGVTLFFFISGYLITRLLIAEYEQHRRINIGAFYARRVLRLYPALLVMVVLATGFTVVMDCDFQPKAVLSTLFYYRNYYMMYGGDAALRNCSRIFDITWSLAIEEHFYLFFPLLFLALFRWPAALISVMVSIIGATLLLRLHIVATEGLTDHTISRIYYLTDTRLDGIMFGCLTSVVLHLDRAGTYLRRISHPVVFIGAAGLVLFTFVCRSDVFRETWRYTLQGVALSGLLPAVLYGRHYTGLSRLLSQPKLVLVGKWSYSLYLFHWVGLCVAENLVGGPRLTVSWLVTAVPLGITLSLASYYYVEKPTAFLRKRFGSTMETSASAAPTESMVDHAMSDAILNHQPAA